MIDYLNNTVWATLKPSPIHGIGVFAIRDIPKGTVLSDNSQGLLSVSRQDFSRILPEIQAIILDRTLFAKDGPLVFKSPNSTQDLRAFMNHSSQPNSDGVRATTDIRAGEEITEDYKAFYELDELSTNHFSWLN